jgi:type II secretory pathway pseudopilin PulG
VRRLRGEEAGFTLIELLVSTGLLLLVMSATLGSWDQFNANGQRTREQNDQQEIARNAEDQLARELRSLANPASVGATIDTAQGYRLIFQTNDPRRRWVGYCLDSSSTGTPSNARLWLQTSTVAAITTAMRTGCPAAVSTSDWADQRIVAERVTNVINGQDRPVFQYDSSAADTATVRQIWAKLFVDADPSRRPPETQVASGVFLRNQNQAPTAAFTATAGQTNTRTYTLDGSLSSDPEGRALEYRWYKGSGNVADMPDCTSAQTSTANGSNWTCLGMGIVLTYKFPASDASPQQVRLKVTDPGGLSGISDPLPSGGLSLTF